MTLKLKPPKSSSSYSANLEPLVQDIAFRLLGDPAANWAVVYPVAKSYLLQSEAKSVTSVYQNKYTLHRSFSVCCALGVWSLSIAVLLSLLLECIKGIDASVHYPSAAFLIVTLLYAVKQFSDSYLYNWVLWGNYLVTEVYCHLRMKGNGSAT